MRPLPASGLLGQSCILAALLVASTAITRSDLVLKSATDLEKAVLSAGASPVVVMYTGPSCTECSEAALVLEALKRAYGESLIFATVDVKQATALAESHGITALPTFQFFHSSSLVQQFSSADSDAVLQWTKYVAQLAGVQQPPEHDLLPQISDGQLHELAASARSPEPQEPESHDSYAEFDRQLPPQPTQPHLAGVVEPQTAQPPSYCRDKRLKGSVEEVIIIGAGPSGLSAAIYVARAGLCPLILAESCSLDPHKLSSSRSCNYPAVPDRNGSELVESMWEQARSFDAELVADSVVRLDVSGWQETRFTVHTARQGALRARSVIVATGTTLRQLEVEGEEAYRGRGISWCAHCDADLYSGQPCAVVGGGTDALRDALMLARICSRVTLIHDMTTFSAGPVLQEQVASNPKVEVRLHTRVVKFAGAGGHLTHLELLQTSDASVTQGPEMLEASAAFVSVGHVPNTDFLAGLADLDEQGSVIVLGRSSQTSVPGIFAAGAAISNSGALMAAVVAAGSGAAAALDAERYLSGLSGVSSESIVRTAVQTIMWAGLPMLILFLANGPQEVPSYRCCPGAAAMMRQSRACHKIN